MDNYGTHNHPNVKAWLAKHPRFHLHFTPTSNSWLNLVERWFRELTDKAVRRGVFPSVDHLIAAIDEGRARSRGPQASVGLMTRHCTNLDRRRPHYRHLVTVITETGLRVAAADACLSARLRCCSSRVSLFSITAPPRSLLVGGVAAFEVRLVLVHAQQIARIRVVVGDERESSRLRHHPRRPPRRRWRPRR